MHKLLAPWQIERKLIVKAEEEADPRYGHRPNERPIQDYIRFGIINLDKPAGPSSHEVTAWAKRLLDIERAGHGGTLDPKVTGILPVALQEAAKTLQALLYSGKEYVCVTRLHAKVDEPKIQGVLNEFQGTIYQRPPIRASVKRQLRTRKIYYLNLLETNERNILFQVACQAGTYIRKLSHDIGEALGCGAHMQELRRTRSGPLAEDTKLVTLHDVAYYQTKWKETDNPEWLYNFIQPMETALQLLPKVTVRDSAVDAICHGANLAVPGILNLETNIRPNTMILIQTQKSEAVALARATKTTNEILKMRHGIIAKTERVLMPRGTYPKTWRTTKV
ncbi:MAG: RNA-guided pseudouridylation complex pseudouridine synthase subunit Cbf5 [Candidatus Bathyarchaeota archaeon]|nr:RNA-guided pseudouridylation complex pseudouridine synthase subunit Cbf5 [Candidatus Bathyarchaeota archaeon]